MDLYKYSALELGQMIREKRISVKEVVECIDIRIKRINDVNGYITLNFDEAINKAEKIQSRICNGETLSPLAGVPIAVKDNILTEGIKTTCGSRMLQDFIPAYSATAAKRLEDAGMIILGKTNMDEFAMGSTGETSFFGAVRNPWDLKRVAGGSSSGSAAAVACGGAVCSVGSDTGGSIRLPAAYCGVTGVKPSYGRVSRCGLVAHCSSMDQIGPIGRDVLDCKAVLDIIKGSDKFDFTSVNGKELSGYIETFKGVKIGVIKEYFEKADLEVSKIVMEAVAVFKKLGAEIHEISVGKTEEAVSAYYILACAEASSNLSRFDGLKYGCCGEDENVEEKITNSRTEGFGVEVKRRIIMGNFVLSSGYYDDCYRKAVEIRRRLTEQYREMFKEFDLVLSPSALTVAPSVGGYKNKRDMYMNDSQTVSANLTGVPAMSIPCGTSKNGLPVGLQLIADYMNEEMLFYAGALFQRETDFHKKIAEVNR